MIMAGAVAEATEDRGDDLKPVAVPVEDDKKTEEIAAKDEVQAKTEVVDEPAKAEEQEQEPKAAEPDTNTGQMVPFIRFRAQNIKLREAEKLVQDLSKQVETLRSRPAEAPPAVGPTPSAATRDFDAEIAEIDKKLELALADNDATAVLAAQREIRTIERARYQAELDAVRAQTQQTQNTIHEQVFEDTLSMVESEFPELDPNSDTFSPTRQRLVQDLLRAYESQGMSSEDGLLQAVALAYPDSDLGRELLGTAAAVAETPKPATPAKPAPRGSVADKVAAARALPPDLNAAGGENSDVAGMKADIDVAKLSDAEFLALPKEVRARLRGDFL